MPAASSEWTRRRIARPEQIAAGLDVSKVVDLEAAPWLGVPSRDLCHALGINPLTLGDWRLQGRKVPPHEDPALYPRARGYVYRIDKVLRWMHELQGRPQVLELWQIGSHFVHATLGTRSDGPVTLNRQIIQMQRLGIFVPRIKPMGWPDYAPYAVDGDASQR